MNDINEQYQSEFLEGLQTSMNAMSAAGIRISFVTSKAADLSRYMADALDDSWRDKRGMEILAVGLASINYDQKSRELIDLRNQGAMLGDPTIRAGYVAGAVARGVESAGSNAAGNMNGFMGVGIGASMAGMMGAMGGAMNGAATGGAAQPAQPAQAAPAGGASWTCSCGATTTGKFCSACGKAQPAGWFCPNCGRRNESTMNFCPDCGTRKP